MSILGTAIALALLGIMACGPAQQAATPTPTSAPATPTATKAAAPTAVVATATPTPTPVGGIVRRGKLGGTFRYGAPDNSEELFCVVNSGGGQHLWGDLTCDALLAYGPDSEWFPEKSLAESFTLGSDFKTITLHLRKGVKFQDGTDFNAEAVKMNLEWVLDGKNGVGFRPQIEAIKSVTVIDPYTVNLNLDRVHSAIITNLGLRSTYAFSPTNFQAKGRAALNSNPVGTGPFMVKEYVPGSHILFEKNPNYWVKGLPYLDAWRHEVIVDDRVRAGALQSGQIDFAGGIPAGAKDALAAARAIPGIVQFNTMGGPSYDHYNANRAPFNDKRVRIALQLAMDRNAWNQAVNNGEGIPYTGGMHVPGHAATFSVPEAEFPYPYNPTKDKALIEEYAKEKGLTLPISTVGAWEPTAEQVAKGAYPLKEEPIIMYATSGSTSVKRSAISKAYYEAIGFKIEVKLGGGDEEKHTFVWKDVGFSLRGVGTRPHPSGSMDSYMGYGGYWNAGGWSTTPQQLEVDRLLRAAANEFDFVKQNDYYKQAQKIWMNEALGGVKTAHTKGSTFAQPWVKMDRDINKYLVFGSDSTAHFYSVWLDKP
jgi:ABC-type transport system substrate-binding protein